MPTPQLINLVKDTRPAQVLNKGISSNRLHHAILLHGQNFEAVESLCLHLASKLLNTHEDKITIHPDFFPLHPVNKMRMIGADDTRELIRKILQTSYQGKNKVAAIYEADRMHSNAANAFLKTLEEPPANTTIFLLTTRPYALLDTIRSRCMNFAIPVKCSSIEDIDWLNWLKEYSAWLDKAYEGSKSKKENAMLIMGIYKLLLTFETITNTLSDSRWNNYKSKLTIELLEEEQIAQKAGVEKNLIHQLYKEIANTTHQFTVDNLSPQLIHKFTKIIAELEHVYSLLEVNLNALTALEAYFLFTLRILSNKN